jgi:voltage-gated sodium channel
MPDEIDRLVNSYRTDKEQDEVDSDDELISRHKPFVDWGLFNMVVGAVITANAITIGLEIDATSGGRSGSFIWFVLEMVFCFLFLAELIARLYFHKLEYFAAPRSKPIRDKDGELPPPPSTKQAIENYLYEVPHRLKYSNIMDFAIVVTSILDTFVLQPLGTGGSARFVSMLRFVRLLRLVRLVRLFKIFKELWLVANGLINAMKTLLWVCVMIFIVCYIAGIFTTLIIGHNDKIFDPYFRSSGWDHEIYFATVPRSVFTLFQVITLDQWSDGVARHVIKNQPAMIIFFLLMICIVTFGLLNIIVGVVVENALSTAAKDQNKIKKAKDRDRQMVFNQLREIFEDADLDNSGTLTYEEVEVAISKPEIYNKLRMIDFPVDDPQQIFALLDYDESGELTIDEFITGCLRMKGTAKSKDLLVAQVALDCMKRHYNQFEKELAVLQDKLRKLDATARAITDHGERVFLDMRQYRMRHPDERGGSIPRMNTMDMNAAPWEAEYEEGAIVAQSPSRHTQIMNSLEMEDISHGALADAQDLAALQGGGSGVLAIMNKGGEDETALAVPGSI